MKIKLLNPAHRKRAKRYVQPYWRQCNLEHYSFKRTFLNNMNNNLNRLERTAQRNEVLFLANAHFLFFNFSPTAQNTLSFFCLPSKPPRKKIKECFLHLTGNSIYNYLHDIANPIHS